MEPSQLVFSEHELRMLDLDKSWDGLNFTFRTLWPEAPSFFEHAAEIANLEVGLGPALYHSSQDMAAFAKNIENVSEQELLTAFEKTDLSKAYLDKFWARRDSEVVAYLIENFLALKAFAPHTAQHSLGAILQFG